MIRVCELTSFRDEDSKHSKSVQNAEVRHACDSSGELHSLSD